MLPPPWALVLALVLPAAAVDRAKFRTCAQTGFCRRLRHSSSSASRLRPAELQPGRLRAALDDARLTLQIDDFRPGVARVRIHEESEPRWSPDGIISAAEPGTASTQETAGGYVMELGDGTRLEVQQDPLVVTLKRGDAVLLEVNAQQKLRYEHRGIAEAAVDLEKDEEDRHGGKKVVDYGEDGLAIYEDGSKEAKRDVEAASNDETFGGHTDHQKFGPSGVAVDIGFPGATDVYGIPEHASSLSLKTTTGAGAAYAEPYRLYTLDVFEYELDNPMALYGAIPVMLAYNAETSETVGVFWHNPSETFVDIEDVPGGKRTHWMSETGNFDLFVMTGPDPKSVMRQYAAITGPTYLPPMFSLGYHQCRWNYKDEKDVAQVHQGFEDHDFPMDVMWLDIEHTNEKRYFTWDKSLFPTPLDMQGKLAEKGRKMVTIVDPHIKRDNGFHVHTEATEKGYYIKNEDGEKDYDGWCWSGSSSYLDFTCPEVRRWWAEQFALDKYEGSSLDLFTWNDMNEPSVFNGPEVTMQKYKLNREGVEHREWHNVYGLYMQMATSQGQTLRHPEQNQRPFVLSRAFYAGSQQYGAIWTGDNMAEWSHLAAAAPMLLSISVAGLGFVGADIGGFMGNPDAELMTRWVQAAAYQPFFRGHAHHDSRRREMWLFGEPWLEHMRTATIERYTFLPYLYTLFAEAEFQLDVSAIMRPLFLEFPGDPSVAKVDDAWMLGPAMLIKPVVAAGVRSLEVPFPGAGPWYDARTFQRVVPGSNPIKALFGRGKSAADAGFKLTVAAGLETIPVYLRGGHVIPRKMRLRRSATLMRRDPYTLVVALDDKKEARGNLYLDDEESLRYKTDGRFAFRRFVYENGALSCRALPGVTSTPDLDAPGQVERIVILGLGSEPRSVQITGAASGTPEDVDFSYDADADVVVLRKPVMQGSVLQDWDVKIDVSA